MSYVGIISKAEYPINQNYLINGNFDVWQRGTSLSSGSGERYLADRWANYSLGSTYTASRQAFTVGQTDVPGEPAYFHRTVVTSVAGASNSCVLRQALHNPDQFANKTVTLSFWAKADSSKNMSVHLSQYFNADPAFTGRRTISTPLGTCGLTTSWQKFEFTTTLPPVYNNTVSYQSNSAFYVQFWFDAGSNFAYESSGLSQQSGTFDIAQVQLESGIFATPFKKKSFNEELSHCLRFFEKSYNYDVALGTVTSAAHVQAEEYHVRTSGVNYYVQNAGGLQRFRRRKNRVPDIILYSHVTGTANRVYLSGAGVTAGDYQYTLQYPSTVSIGYFSINTTVQSTVPSEVVVTYHFSADAEIYNL